MIIFFDRLKGVTIFPIFPINRLESSCVNTQRAKVITHRTSDHAGRTRRLTPGRRPRRAIYRSSRIRTERHRGSTSETPLCVKKGGRQFLRRCRSPEGNSQLRRTPPLLTRSSRVETPAPDALFRTLRRRIGATCGGERRPHNTVGAFTSYNQHHKNTKSRYKP